jgi:E3 ubiquitin-protein ligase NEDD4
MDVVSQPYVYLILPRLTSFRGNDITDILDETFTTTEERFGELVTIELKPGGEDIPVTEENKKEYVEAVVAYRISKRVKDQFDSFTEGLLELIPRDLINVFDERELELLIGGMSEIDMYAFPFAVNYFN